MKKKIYSLFMVLILYAVFIFNDVNAAAYNISNNDIRLFYEEIISDEIEEYVDCYADIYLYSLGVTDEYEVLSPFIIFDVDNYNNQEEIYYFPLAIDEDIEYIMSAFYVEEEINASISKEYAVVLEDINYYQNDNCILYSVEDSLVAVDEKNNQKIYSEENYERVVISEFYNYDYAEKLGYIADNYRKNGVKEASDTDTAGTGFSTKNTYEYILDMNNRTAPQGSENICRAATIATTVNYLRNTTNVTARKVCDVINHSYREGSLSDMVDAMSYYRLINYGITYNQISFDRVGTNIRSEYPIMMWGNSSNGGNAHVVTIIGYSTHGGIQLIKFYNSATDDIESASYNSAGTRYTMGNSTYTWVNTLCAK